MTTSTYTNSCGIDRFDRIRLELHTKFPQRFRKRKPNSKVTIAIALICEDGIVMGSDSRTTNLDHTIRDDAEKIRLLKLDDFENALIAQSGDDDLGTRVVDAIENAAKETKLDDYQSIADVGNRAIADEQQKLKVPFLGPVFSMEEFQNILRGFDSSFMISHWHNGKPYIFTADFYPGRFSTKKSNYFSIGCGSPLANFLLDGFDFSKMTTAAAAAALIYVIEEVKQFDPRCGGPTKIAWSVIIRQAVMKGKPVVLTEQCHNEVVNRYLQELLPIRNKAKEDRNKEMVKIMNTLTLESIRGRCSHERFERLRNQKQ